MRALLKVLKGGIILPLVITALLPLSGRAAEEAHSGSALKKVLLYDYGAQTRYSKSKAYLRKALSRMAEERGFALTATRDQKAINYLDLKAYDVVIFAYGDGDVVASKQAQADFERYVREGGGFVAVHSNPGPIRQFKFLAEAISVRYAMTGGGLTKARLYADSQAIGMTSLHAVYDGLPREVVLRDRWFNFGSNPRSNREVTVLFSVDEASYPFGRMNGDHPIVWTRKMDKGRVVYNGLGLDDVYTQQDGFGAKLLLNLMNYAAAKDSVGPLGKTAALASPAGVTLEGRNMVLSLNEGSYVLRISDIQGRGVFSKTFTGPGQFRAEPALANGSYTLTLTGPATRYRKSFAVR